VNTTVTSTSDAGSIESAVDKMFADAVDVEDTTDEVIDGDVSDEAEDDESGEAQDDASEDDESDAGDEDADQDDQSQEPLHTVKVDGKEQKVTLEELKRGYSGQKYVQEGMATAAAMRKQAEEVYSQLLQERQGIAQLYQQLQQGQVVQPPRPPSKDLFNVDPIGYMEAKIQYDEQVQAYQQQQVQIQHLTQQQSQAERAAMEAHLEREAQALRAAVPELADEGKASQIREQLVAAGAEYGYSNEELTAVTDHRALRVLLDAAKYRQLQAGKQKAVDRAKNPQPKAPLLRPGAKPVSKDARRLQKQKTRLKRSGDISDALDLMLNA
jgi:hypothetical protein